MINSITSHFKTFFNSIPSSLNFTKKLAKVALIGFLALSSPAALEASGRLDICNRGNMKSVCQGNLGIERKNMPQLDLEVRQNFISMKKNSGIVVVDDTLAAHLFIPIQKEMNYENVMGMIKSAHQGTYNPCEDSILVASQNSKISVIDGHHRYAACRLINGQQEATIIHDDIHKILHELKNFTGVYHIDLTNNHRY